MSEQTLIAMLYGALVMAAGFGLYFAGRKAIAASKELISGLKGIGQIAESNKALVEASLMVATELKMLRSLMAENVQQHPTENPFEGQAGPTPPKPRQPFPTPNFDIYSQVPVQDAKVEDTVITDTTDEQLVTYEKIEELRQQGYESDPAELEQEI